MSELDSLTDDIKQKGVFYTKNKNIVSGFELPDIKINVIEPFVGCGDLLTLLNVKNKVEAYDIRYKFIYHIEKYNL